MAITTLDAKTALIVIDLQEGIVALPVVHEPQPVIERCARLASAFREKDLPVVLVNVAGGAPGRNEQPRHEGELPANWATLVPAMTPQHNDLTITKKKPGAHFMTPHCMMNCKSVALPRWSFAALLPVLAWNRRRVRRTHQVTTSRLQWML